MQPPLVLLVTLLIYPILCNAVDYVSTGDCKNNMQNRYNYEVDESFFEGSNKQTMKVSCFVTVTCESVGRYGEKEAHLFNMVVSETKASGDIFDREDNEEFDRSEETTVTTFDDVIGGWFKFVQTDDGTIPAVFHSNAEDSVAINFKKTIAAAFQANFKRTTFKMEADSQSLHVAHYSYAPVRANGVVKMHRSITSGDVEDYSSHIPGDVVDLSKEEDIVYRDGVLTQSSGVVIVEVFNQDSTSGNSAEGDSLEASLTNNRNKRDMDMSEYFEFLSKSGHESEENDIPSVSDTANAPHDDFNTANDDLHINYEDQAATMSEDPTYDSQTDLPDFIARGIYSLDLVGQRRLLRHERSATVNHLELPEATESTLMAHIDHTREDMHRMSVLHSELGNISQILYIVHKDPRGTAPLVRKIEELMSLEGMYGSVSGYTPILDPVLDYLQKLIGSEEEDDCVMRALLYFLLGRDGSYRSQNALLTSLDSAIDEEERRVVVGYIAFTEHPQPQMVSELEERIGSDPHSTDPLLLAYGALVAKASPDLQHRMTLFLLNRLPLIESNSSSLVHHILSLGNTESHQATTYLTDYLHHPDHHVQLAAIYSLRYATNDTLVQKALSTLVSHPNVSEEHIATVLRCLLYGIEHASNTYTEIPFNPDLATALLFSVMSPQDSELQQAFISYLQLVNSTDAQHIMKIMTTPPMRDGYSNNTRLRRGTNWAENNAVYDLVSPLATRQADVNTYAYSSMGYLWGKTYGIDKANLQVAAGGFVGASNSGAYKIFGRAKAIGRAFGKTKTAADVLVLREKSSTSTHTRLYGEIAGKILVNYDVNTLLTCKREEKPLFDPKHKIFDFQHTITILASSLKFTLYGYINLNSNLYVEFCEKATRTTGEAGLATTVTMELETDVTANLLSLVRGGISVSATLNYQLTPQLSTEICTVKGFKVKNCVGIYHEWDDNMIILDVWYQVKKVKWCTKVVWGVSIPYPCGSYWGPKKKWNALSTTWSLNGSPKKPLWEKCDSGFICKTAIAVDPGKVGPIGPLGVKNPPGSLPPGPPLRGPPGPRGPQ